MYQKIYKVSRIYFIVLNRYDIMRRLLLIGYTRAWKFSIDKAIIAVWKNYVALVEDLRILQKTLDYSEAMAYGIIIYSFR